jgi:hypothetical protein
MACKEAISHLPPFCKKWETKHKFYRSKNLALFYIWQRLREVGYAPPILVIPENWAVIFLHITLDRQLNDSLHISQFIYQGQLAPFKRHGRLVDSVARDMFPFLIKTYCKQNFNDAILKLKVMGIRIRRFASIPPAIIDYCFRRNGNTCIDKSMECI